MQCLEEHHLKLDEASRRRADLNEEDDGYDRAKDARTFDVLAGFGMTQVSHASGESTVVDKRQIILSVTLYHLGDLGLPPTRTITVNLEDEVAEDEDGDPRFVGKSFDHLTGLLHAQPGPRSVSRAIVGRGCLRGLSLVLGCCSRLPASARCRRPRTCEHLCHPPGATPSP